MDPEDEHLRGHCYDNGYGYATLKREGRNVLLHRLILSAPKGSIVDHVNGSRIDNRKANLRIVSQKENVRNIKGPRIDSASGLLGVGFHKARNKWRATIAVGGKTLHLGLFSSAQEANLARLKAELELWGPQPRRYHLYVDAGLLPC